MYCRFVITIEQLMSSTRIIIIEIRTQNDKTNCRWNDCCDCSTELDNGTVPVPPILITAQRNAANKYVHLKSRAARFLPHRGHIRRPNWNRWLYSTKAYFCLTSTMLLVVIRIFLLIITIWYFYCTIFPERSTFLWRQKMSGEGDWEAIKW